MEEKYSELKTMKKDEIFVEWAYGVINFTTVFKLPVKRIMLKSEIAEFKKALRKVYNIPYYYSKPDETFTAINLITIEK